MGSLSRWYSAQREVGKLPGVVYGAVWFSAKHWPGDTAAIARRAIWEGMAAVWEEGKTPGRLYLSEANLELSLTNVVLCGNFKEA